MQQRSIHTSSQGARRSFLLRASIVGALCASAAAQSARLREFPQRPDGWDTARTCPIAVLPNGARVVADEVLLTLLDGTSPASLESALESLGARVIGEFPATRLLRVELCDGAFAPDELARFGLVPGVEYAELNGVGEGGAVPPPNDLSFGDQWHLDNTGQLGAKVGADLQILEAWGLCQGSASVTLAVLDSGIDFGHPEFSGRALPGYDFVNQDADPTYDHPHGIYVTGLAAANTDNLVGVAGVDRNCSIVPVKVLNNFNSGTVTDLVEGLDYCAQQGVDVVSMSLINYPSSVALQNALQNARNAGCILVACAGNGGIGNADVSWPGASPQTISIGATNSQDVRASYSGTGNALDVVAPGDGVTTVSLSGGGSASFSGCSAATPVAAGVVALMKAALPTLTHLQAQQLLQDSAEDQVGPAAQDTPGWDSSYGWGRVNAYRAIAATTPCPTPAIYGVGKTSSLNQVPFLTTSGTPRASIGDFAIQIHQGVPNKLAILFRGHGASSISFLGGTLLVTPPLSREWAAQLDGSGSTSFSIGTDATMVGTTAFYQVFFRDLQHPDGTAAGLSNAVQATFCP